MQEGRRIYTEKGRRVSWDLLGYFLLHNLISMFFFFAFTIGLGIYAKREVTPAFFLSSDFWQLTIFQVFPISVISSIAGRITAFYCIKGYVRWGDRKGNSRRTTKRWSELNRGVNRMGLRFLITAFLTSIIYTTVSISLLSYMIFDEKALLPLMVTYFGIKTGIYLFVRWFVSSRG